MNIPDDAVDAVHSLEVPSISRADRTVQLSDYLSREEVVTILETALPCLLADLRDRFVSADKDLVDLIVNPGSSRGVHLAAKAEGVRLALSYLDEMTR